jgi:hypothetical protein
MQRRERARLRESFVAIVHHAPLIAFVPSSVVGVEDRGFLDETVRLRGIAAIAFNNQRCAAALSPSPPETIAEPLFLVEFASSLPL